MRLRGLVRPGGRRPVKVVIRGPHGDLVGDATSHRGGYRLRWKPRRTGTYRLRTYVGRNRLAKRSHSVSRRITVFRHAVASYYGPGLYGGALACGGSLAPGTLGVANKTLPCGTKVTLRYHGRSVTVPVIDRGPYVAGRDYDLTAATKRRLGFPGPRRSAGEPLALRPPAAAGRLHRHSWSSPSKAATRTPSRRTGRGGEYSRSSSVATRPTSAGSLVGCSRVRALLTLVQSSSRTLIPTLRPARSRPRSRWQSCSESRRSDASIAAASETSVSKVSLGRLRLGLAHHGDRALVVEARPPM